MTCMDDDAAKLASFVMPFIDSQLTRNTRLVRPEQNTARVKRLDHHSTIVTPR